MLARPGPSASVCDHVVTASDQTSEVHGPQRTLATPGARPGPNPVGTAVTERFRASRHPEHPKKEPACSGGRSQETHGA